ncbi:MAG: hypothetical protein ABW168_00970, partial [Sedimenticola sp.]
MEHKPIPVIAAHLSFNYSPLCIFYAILVTYRYLITFDAQPMIEEDKGIFAANKKPCSKNMVLI